MKWGYRILKTYDEETISYSMVEAYYDEDDKIVDYTSASVEEWDSVDSLQSTLKHMQGAFEKPVVYMDNDGKFVEEV